MNTPYSAPQVKDLGTLSEQTMTGFHKNNGHGDFVQVGNTVTPIPGSYEV